MPTRVFFAFIATLVIALPAKHGDGADVSSPTDDTNITRPPNDVGEVDPQFWRTLSEDQQTQANSLLKKSAEKTEEKLKHALRLHETKYVLFYSDLTEMEATRYVALLERMYGRVIDLFGLKSQNVWRGKALVFVFARKEDYRLYERLCENTEPGGSVGMTHCFGDGLVHMAFYRYPGEAQFAHLLVHESVHGFLHRYRSPVRIPSWANEGLADALAAELVPNPSRAKSISLLVHSSLQKHNNNLGDFFTARQIDGWQYPIAETLCTWMIRRDSKGYLDFISGIKDGQNWEQSLKNNMKLSKDRLLAEFGKSIGVRPLKG